MIEHNVTLEVTEEGKFEVRGNLNVYFTNTSTLENMMSLTDDHGMMNDDEPTTQQAVFEWAWEQFQVDDKMKLAVRGNKEMAELMSAIVGNQMPPNIIAEECADVAFFLLQICQVCGYDMMAMVEQKLEVNKKRLWEQDADGSFQHKEVE